MGKHLRLSSWKRTKQLWKKGLTSAFLGFALTLGSNTALANPTGPTVRHGQVRITPGVQAQIQQLTDKAIIDWQSFSIGSGESVRFLQPGELSVILNRVTGGDPSEILGSLNANGRVFLINPNGILFGPSSTVNVGGLVASTLNITDEDFLAGNYNFFTDENQDLAAVVNQGNITITDGGYAVLTGPSVINEGTIVAKTGNIVLASGEQATLNLDGRDLVHFALVGTASDGTVLLAPGMMTDTLAQAFGVTPELRANQMVQMADGSVRLVSSSGTTVQNGTVSTDGVSNQSAGDILIDSADVTILGSGSVTSASGVGEMSDGGEILVLSAMDGTQTSRGFTDVQAGSSLRAQGGESGDGGFIEVSGDGVNLHGEIALDASAGENGDFLLDPVLVTIVDGDNAPTTVTNPLTLTTNTIIGDAWFESAAFSGFSTFTLESSGDLLFDLGTQGSNPTGDLAINFRGGAGQTNLTLRAGTDAIEVGDINFGDDGISLTGLSGLNLETDGNILLGDASLDVNGVLTMTTTAGDIDFQTAQLDVDVNTGFNVVDIDSAGGLRLGSSTIDVRESGGNANFVFEAANNIDIGDSSVTLDAVSNGVVTSTFRAGGNILATPGTATPVVLADGNTLFEAGGEILLPGLDVSASRAGTSGTANLTFDAQAGQLDVSGAQISANGGLNLMATGNVVLSNGDLTATGGNSVNENILVDAGGSVVFIGGTINDTLGAGSLGNTGTLEIVAANDITFGDNTLELAVDHGFNILRFDAGQSIDLGDSEIRIRESGGNATLLIQAGTNLDLGSSEISFDALSNGTVTSTFRAGGNILSDPSDGNPGTFVTSIASDGDTLFEAAGSILLGDSEVSSSRAGLAGTAGLAFDAQSGQLDLRDSELSANGSLTLMASGTVNINGSSLTATGGTSVNENILIDAGDSVNFIGGLINQGLGAGSLGNTGTLRINAINDITLGNNTIELAVDHGFDVFRLDAGRDIDLATSDIRVRESGGNANFIIDAGNDLQLGSSDILFDALSNGTVTTTLQAGRNILSDPPDGNPGTFVNNILVDGNTLLQAGGFISLEDSRVASSRAGMSGTASLTFDAQAGQLDLGSSQLSANGGLNLMATSNVILNNSNLTATGGNSLNENILIDAGDSVNFIGGSINQGLGAGSLGNTGTLRINAANDITLGNNTIELAVDHGFDAFRLDAGRDIDLATTDIRVRESGGNVNFFIDSGNDLDLGSSDILFDALSNGTVTTAFRAGGDILSDLPDNNPGTFVNNILVDGNTLLQAGGSISLGDSQVTASRAGLSGTASLTFDAQAGQLDLGDSQLSASGGLNLMATSNVILNNSNLTATGGTGVNENILIDAGDSVSFNGGSINDGLGVGSLANTGTLTINATNDITLGNNTIELAVDHGFDVVRLDAGRDIDLATTDIRVRESGGNASFIIDAGNDLDLGSSDILFDALSNGVVNTTLRAGRNILSDPPDNNPGTFVNNILVDGNTLLEAGESILLGDSQVTASRAGLSGTAALVFDAQSGQLDLRDSELSANGSLTLMASGTVNIDDSDLTSTLGTGVNENILIDAGDSVSFNGGSVNDGLGGGSLANTGTLTINAANDITLGNNTIELAVDHGFTVLGFNANRNIDLGNSDIRVRESGGNVSFLIDAGNDLDLGSSDILFDALSNGVVTTTFRAGNDIQSESADGASGTFRNNITVDGPTVFEALGGNIAINDASITTSAAGFSTAQADLNIEARNGSLDLGESALTSPQDIQALSSGALDAQSAQITATQRAIISSNTSVRADGSMVQAGDLEIFGFNTMTISPDPLIPVADSVELDLSTQTAGDTIELSVFAVGDITINHSGPGTIRTEAAGADIVGVSAPYAIRSQGGNITIQGENRLELGGGDANFASVHSDDTGSNPTVLVGGSEIVDISGGLDIFGNGEVIVQATRSVGPGGVGGAVEVRGQAITVDLSQLEPGFLDNFADIIIDNGTIALEFLDVSGNNSDIRIVEGPGAGPEFRVTPNSIGPNVLNIGGMTANNLIYTEASNEGIELGDIQPGPGKKVAIQTTNGDILGGPTVGNDTLLDGDLLLISAGNIGTQGNKVRAEAGQINAQAGGDIFLESESDELVIGNQIVVENFSGNNQPTGQGVQAQGDVELSLVDAGPGSPRQLRLEGNVTSVNGGVALVVPQGDIIQNGGAVSGQRLSLEVSGAVGNFDMNDTAATRELAVNADQVTFDVGGDLLLSQANGDLTIEDQVIIGGQARDTVGAGGDLRIRVTTGDLTVNGDLTAGGDAALVTGTGDVIGQTIPGSVILNGNVNATTNLVILSRGDIIQTAGVVDSPRLGLGANGAIGSLTRPINIETDFLALNPLAANVNDPTGFQVDTPIQAVGITVNQGTAVTPVPPVVPPAPPAPVPPPVVIVPEDALRVAGEPEEIALPQNQVDLVEEVIKVIREVRADEFVEIDPTRVPVNVTDDDFLRKKFRR